jgi:hypothetical protein
MTPQLPTIAVVRPLLADEVLLFLDNLQHDVTRRHVLYSGRADLLGEAAQAGLIDQGELNEITPRLQQLRRDGLIGWKNASWDRWGDDVRMSRAPWNFGGDPVMDSLMRS